MKTIITGIQPTGRAHIGNYVGAIDTFLENQYKYEAFLFIADLHTLTEIKSSKSEVEKLGRELLLDYLALGVDAEKVSIYFQSDIKEITEIFWILTNFIYVPTLSLGHSYKDAAAKKKEVSAGLLLYPVLMSADIFSVNADLVPVGKDQYQHIEVAREIAKRINSNFNTDILKVVEAVKSKTPEFLGIDGRKMSKSYNNTIPMFEGEDVIRKKIMSIVSNSTQKGEPIDYKNDITFSYHEVFSKDMIDDIKKGYESGSIGFKESKELLIENILKEFKNKYELRKEYENNPQKLKEILERGTEHTRAKAKETLKSLRSTIGLTGSSIIE